MSNVDKRWDGLTVQGELTIGVYYSGLRHKHFTLRVAMTGDLVKAQQDYPQGPLQLVTVDVYRRQLLALGDIPIEALTTDLLLEELTEADLAQLGLADEVLEKKLKPPSAASPTGAESSTPLSATATD
jgi:hypothetical protein